MLLFLVVNLQTQRNKKLNQWRPSSSEWGIYRGLESRLIQDNKDHSIFWKESDITRVQVA